MNRVILKKKDKNFVLYIYLEEKFELMYIYIYILFIEMIVRDFEKWRLEVSSGTIFRRKAGRERERERDWEEGPVTTAALRSSESCVFPNSFEQVSSRLDINRIFE